ncbi:hypothetical protein SUGI_0517740 [Cryptomeria japonica]|nr:hypothetical protein SUGI_0517740 [Cryptomeria japonica]
MGYQCIRPLNNINLNLDAKVEDEKHHSSLREGAELLNFLIQPQAVEVIPQLMDIAIEGLPLILLEVIRGFLIFIN